VEEVGGADLGAVVFVVVAGLLGAVPLMVVALAPVVLTPFILTVLLPLYLSRRM